MGGLKHSNENKERKRTHQEYHVRKMNENEPLIIFSIIYYERSKYS